MLNQVHYFQTIPIYQFLFSLTDTDMHHEWIWCSMSEWSKASDATAADDSGGGLVASAAGVFDLSSAVKQQLLSF